MDVRLSLNPDAEAGLLARARSRGVSPDDYVREIVEKEIGLPQERALSPEEKADAFIQWAESFPDGPPLSDEPISRESMYPDRW
jgi:hypothetical protein